MTLEKPSPIAPDTAEKPKKPETGGRPEKPAMPKEIGGVKGPEPTRYGDWDNNGRCTDF